MIQKIRKRDGREINFVPEKITRAIYLAASAVAKEDLQEADYETSEILTDKVISYLNQVYKNEVPNVEDVQDAVVRVLIENGHVKTSEAYILYRNERSRVRETKSRLMKTIDEITYREERISNLDNAIKVKSSIGDKMYAYARAVSNEYTLTRILRPEFSKAHESGEIHIHDLEFYSLGSIESISLDLTKLFTGGFSSGLAYVRPPQDINSYVALTCIAIQSAQNDVHKEVNIPYFDYDMANGVKKTFRKKFINNLKKIIEIKYQLDLDLKSELERIEKDCKSELSLNVNEDVVQSINKFIRTKLDINDIDVDKLINQTIDYALNESEAKTFQAMEGFIHNLNCVHSKIGATLPIVSINVGTNCSLEGRMVTRNLLKSLKNGLGNYEEGEYPIVVFKVKESINLNSSDPNYDLYELACNVSETRKTIRFIFNDVSYFKKYDNENDYHYEICSNGSGICVNSNVNGLQDVSGRGVASSTSINLVRIGLKHGIKGIDKCFNEELFFNELEKTMGTIINELIERSIVQANKKVTDFPFIAGQGIVINSENLEYNDTLKEVIKNLDLVIGIVGLKECVYTLCGNNIGENDKANKLAIKILEKMYKLKEDACKKHCMNFVLASTSDHYIKARFNKLDNKEVGSIINDEEYHDGVDLDYDYSEDKNELLEVINQILEGNCVLSLRKISDKSIMEINSSLISHDIGQVNYE